MRDTNTKHEGVRALSSCDDARWANESACYYLVDTTQHTQHTTTTTSNNRRRPRTERRRRGQSVRNPLALQKNINDSTVDGRRFAGRHGASALTAIHEHHDEEEKEVDLRVALTRPESTGRVREPNNSAAYGLWAITQGFVDLGTWNSTTAASKQQSLAGPQIATEDSAETFLS